VTPRYTPLAAGLPASVPFVGPEAQERAMGRPFRARIGANESVFGPSPRAIAAIADAAAEAWKYGDPECHDLKVALARHHGIAPGNVVIGEGIDGLLGLLVRLLVEPGIAVVTSRGTYPTFNYHVVGFGGRLHAVPYHGDRTDPAALARAARETASPLVYLANPDNPMGGFHAAGIIRDLLAALPEGCLLCLDEAYADTAPAAALLPLDVADPRLIRMRTFSKAHGLAGLRVGYAIGQADLVRAFDKVRNHFGVGRVAQAAALAAIADTDHLARTVARIAAGRDALAELARAHGLTPLPSATNFVTIDCGRDGEHARALVGALARRGVFVRMPFVAPQDRCIRVSVGTDADLAILAEALPDALAELRG
jgi:histidinol-phosphate aminotransferase